jgi:SAM-dependent methyltransferase
MEKNEYFRMYTLETDFWWYKTLHELVSRTIGESVPEGRIRMLDAGCGTGRMMQILSKFGEVVGIDYSDEAIFFARKRASGHILKGDLNHYRFDKESFHVVVCLDVLYHSGIRDEMAVINHFYEILKPGGILILNLPAFECLRREHDQVVHTRERYRKKTFTARLRLTGFGVVKAVYRLPLLFFIILILKKLKGKKSEMKPGTDLKALPDWLNSCLMCYGRIDNFLISKGIEYPVGSSLYVVAKKPFSNQF